MIVPVVKAIIGHAIETVADPFVPYYVAGKYGCEEIGCLPAAETDVHPVTGGEWEFDCAECKQRGGGKDCWIEQ